jgi:hypothetical protein
VPGPNAITFLQDIMLPLMVAGGLVALSVLIGMALLASRRSDPTGVPEVASAGFSIALVATWIGTRVAGPTGGIAAVVMLVLGSTAILIISRRRAIARPRGASELPQLAAAAMVAALGSLLPFVASGRFGIPGVGLNDDSAAHLYWVLHLVDRGTLPASIADSGYPTGPHALMATVTSAMSGTPVESVLVGFMIAVLCLTAITALGALREVPSIPRVLIAAIVPLVYLNAAYFAQSAFKEPLAAMLALGLAVLVGGAVRCDPELPLGVVGVSFVALSAALFLSVGLTGLAWPGALVILVAGIGMVRHRRRLMHSTRFIAFASGVFVLCVVGTWLLRSTIATQLETLRNLPAGGNVPAYLPFVEVFGVWRVADFRGTPQSVVAASALAGAAGLVFIWAVVWFVRNGRLEIPAVALTTMAIYAISRMDQGPYWVAKLLAIASPMVLLISLGALSIDARRHGARTMAGAGRWLVAGTYATLALVSTTTLFLATPVSSLERIEELAPIRSVIEDQAVLFLGQDPFIDSRLRSTRTSHFSVYSKENEIAITTQSGVAPAQGALIDFDTVSAETLDQFEYVLTMATQFGSEPPANWESVRRTDAYELFQRSGTTTPRQSKDDDGLYGWTEPCNASSSSSQKLRPRGEPYLFDAAKWTLPEGAPSARVEGTLILDQLRPIRQHADLAEGEWDLVMMYQSSIRVRVRVNGEEFVLPPEPDTLGQRWPIGRVAVGENEGVDVEIQADASALKGPKQALVGTVAAAPVESAAERLVNCGRFVDWAVPDGDASR